MAGIPPSILREMRNLFHECSEFSSTSHLHALFVDTRLHPFRNNLPGADSPEQRVDNTIAYLHNRNLRDGRNALVNLVLVLAERYEEQYLGVQLRALAERANLVLANINIADVERYLTAGFVSEDVHQTTHTGYEQIIGTSNLKDIHWLQLGLRAAQPVCRILLENGGLGTGFLVTDKLLLTNNHVLPTMQSAASAVAEFNYQYDFDGTLKATQRYSLNPTAFKTNIALDYTLVGINHGQDSHSQRQWSHTRINTQAEPIPGEHVIIIQHPGGEPKQIAMNENYVNSVSQPFIRYTTDTRPGSSGAPVFNDGWQVIALHHRSVDTYTGAPGQRRKLNEGILISYIFNDAADIWSCG